MKARLPEKLYFGESDRGLDIYSTSKPVDTCYEMIVKLHELNLL